jgi:branched-chain amino acid aminotransferase
MMTCSWNASTGWAAPEIRPYGPLSIMPIASVLHYATECFEGLKAYRGHDGKVRLFRPERNAARLLRSANRISLPGFPPAEFLKLLKRFVAIDAPKWLPKRGSFLYLRPTMIGTAPALGVQKPKEALLYIFAVCFPPLDEPKHVPNPVTGKISPGMRLLASNHDMIRAWPGGFGYAKVGANYGPSLVAQGEARDRGYDQILWLFGEECYATEAGGSNLFVLWKTKDGKLQLVTAPLDDGVILEGVTRNSVISLVQERLPEIELVERKYTMHEMVEAHEEGRLIEAFGSGTAFFIAPVADIHFRGKNVDLPLARGVEAKYAMMIKGWLKDIMYGREGHEWGHVIKEEIL